MYQRISFLLKKQLLIFESFGIEGKIQSRLLWHQACRQARFARNNSGQHHISQRSSKQKTTALYNETSLNIFRQYSSRGDTLFDGQMTNRIEHRGVLGQIFTRLYAKKASKSKGKTKKPLIDTDMAEGIVDIGNLENKMGDVIEDLQQNFAAKIPSRITPGFIDKIMIKIGSGKKVPLYEIAQVQTNNDVFQINIQDNIPDAAKLISEAIADTGFNLIPQIKGNTITIPIPVSTEDHRQSMAKLAKGISDEAKGDLRKVRQKGMSDIRKNKEGQSKDLIRRIENQVQQLTDYYTQRIESALDMKVKEMTGGKMK